MRLIIIPVVLTSAISLLSLSTETGCGYCDELRWGYGYGAFDQYNVNATLTTPLGTHYDPSGLPISPQLIDRLVGEVNTCLQGVAPNNVLPSDVVKASMCASTNITLPINRQSFQVKVASDWVYSCDKTQELLPVDAGSAGCIANGLTPTDSCPCKWRAGIKCPNSIITTPSFYLFKDALTRYITGCQNPWASALANCATPSTTMLSDGTDPNNGLTQ